MKTTCRGLIPAFTGSSLALSYVVATVKDTTITSLGVLGTPTLAEVASISTVDSIAVT